MLGETNNDYIHQYYLFDNTHLSLALLWLHLCSEQEPKRRMGGEGDAQRQKIATGSEEDTSGSLGLTASSHWAVMRHNTRNHCEASQVLARWRRMWLSHLPGGCNATHTWLKIHCWGFLHAFSYAAIQCGTIKHRSTDEMQAVSPDWGLLVRSCMSTASHLSSFSLSDSSSISSSCTLALMASSSCDTTKKVNLKKLWTKVRRSAMIAN